MHITLVLFISLSVFCVPLAAQPALPYEVVEDWPQLPNEIKLGAAMGTAVDAAGNVWLYNRSAYPVIQFSPAGKVLQAWPDHAKIPDHTATSHGMRISPGGDVWLVSRETNRIWCFSPKREMKVSIGSFGGMSGDNNARYAFDRPAGLAFDSKGNVYVADGYGNTRVVKYTRDGKYIKHWGGAGDGNGQFKLVHDVAIDEQDRVYVADRGNQRVQVFDAEGKFITKWEGIGVPWGLAYDPWRKLIWMCDGDNGRITKLDLDGKVLGVLGKNGTAPGEFSQAHNIAVDQAGNVYVAETKNSRIQKFAPK